MTGEPKVAEQVPAEPAVTPAPEAPAAPAAPAEAPVAPAPAVAPVPEVKASVVTEPEVKPVVPTDKEVELQKALDAKNKEAQELAEKIKADRTREALKNKIEDCKRVVLAMRDRNLIRMDEKDIEAAQKDGLAILEAQNKAYKQAIDRQLANLMKMDMPALRAFAESIVMIPKRADQAKNANTLSTVISPMYTVNGAKDDDATFLQAVFSLGRK
jgi:hypothetical protein